PNPTSFFRRKGGMPIEPSPGKGCCHVCEFTFLLATGPEGVNSVVLETPMFRRRTAFRSLAVLLLLAAVAPFVCAQSKQTQPKHEKTVWNFDGGISLITDGSVPDGPCFRLTGRMFAPEFFENLKRVDSELGTIYRRGNDVVSVFPEKMHLQFMM